MQQTARLERILERLESGEDPEAARREADAFMKEVGTAELVHMEEELVARGMPHERMRHLCASHTAATEGRVGAFRASLPEGHVVATLMDEHVRILAHLDRLEALVEPAARNPEDEQDAAALVEIASIGAHLIGAEPHHEREEKVLFPALLRRGIAGPPTVMTAEHVELRLLKKGVKTLAEQVLAGESTFWPLLRNTASRLVEDLRAHIAKEDNVLYPLAVEQIRDPAEWLEMKHRCDEIGYCCHGHGHAHEASP